MITLIWGITKGLNFSAIRQAYLQNGGNDPDYLAQMSQMQAEAQAIEDEMNKKKKTGHLEVCTINTMLGYCT